MCECKNKMWTFILTPTGILPSREFYQGYINSIDTLKLIFEIFNHYNNLDCTFFQTNFITLDLFTGKKLEHVIASTHNVDVPHVKRIEYIVRFTFCSFSSIAEIKKRNTVHGAGF